MNRKKIMIVDDTPINIKVLMTLLGDEYEYSVAISGEAALEMLGKINPALILLDVVMPGMDGFELCRKIKSDPEKKNIPLIFLTSLNEEQDERAGRDLGALDFLYKPFNGAKLKATVKKAISDFSNQE